MINDLTWVRLCYPPGFFSKTLEGDKRSIGLKSEIEERSQPCV